MTQTLSMGRMLIILDRIRELHQPCLCCAEQYQQCRSCYRPWPCPTKDALDGEQE